MSDFVYVNIYNEGQIPWMSDVTGPVFGMHLATGFYQFLARDPRVRIEITTLEEAREAERKYKASLKKEEPVEEKKVDDRDLTLEEQVEVAEAIKLSEEPLSDADNEIDSILAEEEAVATYESVDSEIKELLSKPKVYAKEDLLKMSRKELSEILIKRGYAPSTKAFEKSSEFAPKYHDTIEVLAEKVLKTQ